MPDKITVPEDTRLYVKIAIAKINAHYKSLLEKDGVEVADRWFKENITDKQPSNTQALNAFYDGVAKALPATTKLSLQPPPTTAVEELAPEVIETTEGSQVPAQANQKINPYQVSFGGKTAQQQASQMLDDIEIIFVTNPEARVAITYSANNDQAEAIIKGYDTGSFSIGGSNQAEVFRLLAEQIKAKNLQDRIHILPISTCEHAGGVGTLKQEHVDRDMQNIARHLGAGWTVLGLKNEHTPPGKYAIGGGVVAGFSSTDLGRRVNEGMQQMTQGTFTSVPVLQAAYEEGRQNPNTLLLKRPEALVVEQDTSPPLPVRSKPKARDDVVQAPLEVTVSSTERPEIIPQSRQKEGAGIQQFHEKVWGEFSKSVLETTRLGRAERTVGVSKPPVVTKDKIVFPDSSVIAQKSTDGSINLQANKPGEGAEQLAYLADKAAQAIRNNGSEPKVTIDSGSVKDIVILLKQLERSGISFKNVELSDGVKTKLQQATKQGGDAIINKLLTESPSVKDSDVDSSEPEKPVVSRLDEVYPPIEELPQTREPQPPITPKRDAQVAQDGSTRDIADEPKSKFTVTQEMVDELIDRMEEGGEPSKSIDVMQEISDDLIAGKTLTKEQQEELSKYLEKYPPLPEETMGAEGAPPKKKPTP